MPFRIFEIISERVKLLHEPPPKPQQQENQHTKKPKQLTSDASRAGIGSKSADRKSENNLKNKK